MIRIYEQYGYAEGSFKELSEENHAKLEQDEKDAYSKSVKRKRGEEQLCFSVVHNDATNYKIKSTYMVGVDWVVPNELAIYVAPKLNKNKLEIDYLTMLFEALQEPENLNHLDHLFHIDFDAPLIEIEQQQDKLTPFLILEYLQLLKQIVRKGLKKSYYKKTTNLNARVKGKILLNATVKQNHTQQKMLHTVCQYEEFGYNSLENKILKKALQFAKSTLTNILKDSKIDFTSLTSYILPAFQSVSDHVDIRQLKQSRSNPLFKEYAQALKLAKIILKKYSYNITQTTQKKYKTQPFWIDMSQLFELYTFKKLREIFPLSGEINYHQIVNRVEPDFILKSADGIFKMVIDAKYKPRYKSHGIELADARQVSGYARLKKMYPLVGEDDYSKVIECLIVYSDQKEGIKVDEKLSKKQLKKAEIEQYAHFYKLGIQLPELF